MKKTAISLILALSITASAFAENNSSKLNQAIKLYKNKNYLGAMQSLENITASDPGSALAHYYLGMCYVQAGAAEKASTEYDKVITLSPSSELAKSAAVGKSNLAGTPQPTNQDSKVIPVTAIQKDFLSEDAKQKIQDKNIKTIIDNVNNNREINHDIYNRLENYDKTNKKSSNDIPTKEQIAEALLILSKAGINPNNATTNYAQTPQINPEMMQMNMLMSTMGGGNNMNNNNSMNNMMPLLMMMQNGQGNTKVDPETIQVMMSQMMMPGMSSLYENNNNNN